MSKGSFIRKSISTTWFQAAFPAVIIIGLFPVLGSRYNLSIEAAGGPGDIMMYCDLNSDGISEKIIQGKGVPYFYITVFDSDNQIFDQWNLPGEVDPVISKIFTGNFDNDQYGEIYIFTRINDSLFLNINELIQTTGTRMDKQFITKIGVVNDEVTSFLEPIGFFDENGDEVKEFYFAIATAFTQQPRKIYFFDIVNMRLKSSQYSASICLYPDMRDVDGDNKPEIFGLSSASGNYRRSFPYTDSSSWFMVFNDQLEFKFPPVEFPGFATSIETRTYRKDNAVRYFLSYWNGGTDTSLMDSQILVFDKEGKMLGNRFTREYGFKSVILPLVIEDMKSDRVYLIGDMLLEVNDDLDVIKREELPFHTGYYTYKYDLNYDKVEEIILHFFEENKVAIYDLNLRELIVTDFIMPSDKWRFSDRVSPVGGVNKTLISSGSSRYFLQLEKNKYYYLMYLAFPGIYFLFYFFIILIKRFNTFQVVEKESLKQRLTTLQLQGIKSQLDPHFTFNTLNSIASLIYLEDRQAAYDYMNKFTQMLRVMLNDAERLYRSLGEEIEFVTTYLELEKLRFGEKFNYIIDIKDGVTQKEQVPKLVLQTFAENAIKHGLMPCSDGGILKITAERENDYLKLSIEDNGIGREKSSGRSTSTGKGLKLTGEFYDILNQMNSRAITHTFIDLYNENGQPAGTKVDVMVPVNPVLK